MLPYFAYAGRITYTDNEKNFYHLLYAARCANSPISSPCSLPSQKRIQPFTGVVLVLLQEKHRVREMKLYWWWIAALIAFPHLRPLCSAAHTAAAQSSSLWYYRCSPTWAWPWRPPARRMAFSRPTSITTFQPPSQQHKDRRLRARNTGRPKNSFVWFLLKTQILILKARFKKS